MASGTVSKSGVVKYRSPVSGNIHNTFAPSGAVSQTFSAPASVAPPEIPVKIPSLRAKARVNRKASSPLMGNTLSIHFASTASSVSFGIKSGLHPCIKCGRKFGWLPAGLPCKSRGWGIPLPRICELSGSQTMILVSGLFSASTRATPFSVPPVPYPVTK